MQTGRTEGRLSGVLVLTCAQALTGTGLIAAFAVFFAVNIVVNQGLRDARIDLTEAKLYTLSEGTRNVAES